MGSAPGSTTHRCTVMRCGIYSVKDRKRQEGRWADEKERRGKGLRLRLLCASILGSRKRLVMACGAQIGAFNLPQRAVTLPFISAVVPTFYRCQRHSIKTTAFVRIYFLSGQHNQTTRVR